MVSFKTVLPCLALDDSKSFVLLLSRDLGESRSSYHPYASCSSSFGHRRNCIMFFIDVLLSAITLWTHFGELIRL